MSYKVLVTSGGPLPDRIIRESIKITPMTEKLVSKGVISYGLSSFGYDIRVANKFKVFDVAGHAEGILDPKNLDPRCFKDIETDLLILPPHGFALAETVEYIDMPDNVIAVCLGKSTYARVGLVVGVTPIESGWRGKITLELSNTTPFPMKVYANEGIAQLIFHAGAGGYAAETSYAARNGKYQDQPGIVLPFVQ